MRKKVRKFVCVCLCVEGGTGIVCVCVCIVFTNLVSTYGYAEIAGEASAYRFAEVADEAALCASTCSRSFCVEGEGCTSAKKGLGLSTGCNVRVLTGEWSGKKSRRRRSDGGRGGLTGFRVFLRGRAGISPWCSMGSVFQQHR